MLNMGNSHAAVPETLLRIYGGGEQVLSAMGKHGVAGNAHAHLSKAGPQS